MVKVSLRVVALSLGLLGSHLWGQTFESLYSFALDGSDGAEPRATLTVGPDNGLYGTASLGGVHGAGSIFKVSLNGDVVILNDFETSTTGKKPYARLVNTGDGSLYGVTTENGGVIGDPAGTVYRLGPNGSLSVVSQLRLSSGTFPRNPHCLISAEFGALHVLGREPGGLWRVPLDGSPALVTRNFSGTAAEGSFHERMILGSDGFLYGGSYAGGDDSNGMLFRVAPDGAGFTRLHSCKSETGIRPIGAMVEGPDGNFYGVMSERGGNNGVIYRLTPAGDYRVLHTFKDLRYPVGDLMIATDGYIYGTAMELGVGGNGNGGIFRIRPDGTGYKVVYGFATNSTAPFYPVGRTPVGGLVQGADGNLYGTTKGGGTYDRGTIFRLKLKLPVPPTNRPPAALDDYVVSNGEAVTVRVVDNDYDPDLDALQVIALATEPEFGVATVQSDGTILYTPNAGYSDHDAFTYEISDKRGGFSLGKVTVGTTQAGPSVLAGSYNGLLNVEQGATPKGRFFVTVSENGSFSGTLYAGKSRVPLKGKFDEDGIAILTAKLPKEGGVPMLLFFPAGKQYSMEARLFKDEVWKGEGGLAVLPTATSASSYTVQISSDENDSTLPAGCGYGVMSIRRTGTVSMIGKLADGTKLSLSSTLAQYSDHTGIPILAVPAKDAVFGTVAALGELDRFESTARWIRPGSAKGPYNAGFNGTAKIEIVPFAKPQASDPVISIGNGFVEISGGPINTATRGLFTLEGSKTTAAAPLRTLTFNRGNGLFSGTMKVGHKTLNFSGAINQSGGYGLGSVFVSGVSGKVLLAPQQVE